jgi:exodeoxyribonuclease I
MSNSFYWHDYETFGIDPRSDRPAQFAGIRTDEEFNVISDPLVIYCQPADDMLPSPEACMVTGITPQLARDKGVPEAEFFKLINQEFSLPGTCVLGYNNLRFDDEVTRFGFFRNFIDPYAREWQGGNSRWDIIDMVRVTYALRPEGIEWPLNEEGVPSFRLEELTRVNGITHEAAHDALSDVYATIAMARLIRERQPRLYDYLYQHRNKQWVLEQLDVRAKTPLLHTSSRYPSRIGCTTMVVPVARDPGNPNAIWVYDLRQDPEPFMGLDARTLADRIFTSHTELDAQNLERLPVKAVHANRCPVLAPVKTLDDAARERLQLDETQCLKHLEILRSWEELETLLPEALQFSEWPEPFDPEQSLYSGPFFSNADRQIMQRVLISRPEELAQQHFVFEDRRLPEMLFRYRARNYPDTLTRDEKADWNEYREYRLTSDEGGANITLPAYFEKINQLRDEYADDPDRLDVLRSLEEYGNTMKQGFS